MDTINTLYDGQGFYTTINDSFSVADEVSEIHLWVPAVYVSSTCAVMDLFDFDTIVNIVDDPGYLILQTEATHIDNFNSLEKITIDESNNLIGVSNSFLWKITPTGQLLTQKFLYPICDGPIIDCKWYGGYLYILYNTTVPRNDYHICNDLIGISDAAAINNHDYGYRYFPYEFDFPPPSWKYVLLPEYSVFRVSKYDITGTLISSFDILSDTIIQNYQGNYLLAPSSIDIFNDIIFIADTGDASIKTYDLFGTYRGRAVTNSILCEPIQVFVETENYLWVTDTAKPNVYGNTHIIKKININDGAIIESYSYTTKPLLTFSRTGNMYDTFVLLRTGDKYKLYKNFSVLNDITAIINGHSIQAFNVSNSRYAYIMNLNPVDVRKIDLLNKTTTNLRECTKPITVQDIIIENNEALITDSGLETVGFYHLFGIQDSVIIDHVYPRGIVDLNGVYYITDIQKNILYKIENSTITPLYNNDFVKPYEITTDGEYLYVIDIGANQILKLDTSGNTIAIIGKSGSGNGEFNYPTSIVINSSIIYVLDSNNFRVQIFDLDGNFLNAFVLSPPMDPIKLHKSLSTIIGGDVDDAYESSSGCKVWGNMSINYDYRFMGLRFNISLPRNIELLNTSITIQKTDTSGNGLYPYTLKLIENMENTGEALPYMSTSNPDLMYRPLISNSYDIIWMVKQQDTIVTTPDLSKQLNQLISSDAWSMYSTNAVSFIFLLDSNYLYINGNATSLIFTNNTAILNIEYNEVKSIRRKGMFYHLIVDDSNFYVSDISDNKINSYSKETGSLITSYNFYGTVMEKLTNDIFIANRNCSISYIEKYAWEREKLYTMEFDDNSDIVLYTFEPSWETVEYIETFEQSFFIDFLETFEWFGSTEFVEEYSTEFDLSLPVITWVD